MNLALKSVCLTPGREPGTWREQEELSARRARARVPRRVSAHQRNLAIDTALWRWFDRRNLRPSSERP
jgi:hypothetical protein